MKTEKIDQSTLLTFFHFIKEKGFKMEYNSNKRTLRVYTADNNADQIIKIRLPLNLEMDQLEEKSVEILPKQYIIVVVKSGMACVGLFKNYENIDHKVFRAYMVRKKQGKSQIKHLKTKGKSRAGSRVRLAETLLYFEEINKRLQVYFKGNSVDLIIHQISDLLHPYFYGSKIAPPFQKKDTRLYKLPVHVNQPTYETLLKLNSYLLKAQVGFNEIGEKIWDEFQINLSSLSQSEDENW